MVYYHILGFYVTMHDSLRMRIVQPFKNLIEIVFAVSGSELG